MLTPEPIILRNAIIANIDISKLSFMITLDYGGMQQLASPPISADFSQKFLQIVHTDSWLTAQGKPIRAKASEGKIFELGDFLQDVWITV